MIKYARYWLSCEYVLVMFKQAFIHLLVIMFTKQCRLCLRLWELYPGNPRHNPIHKSEQGKVFNQWIAWNTIDEVNEYIYGLTFAW